jgi:PLP dependent protein
MTNSEQTDLQQIQIWQERIQTFRRNLPETVRIVAVTKTMPVEAIRAAYAAGLRDVGESRVQEAIEKQAALCDLSDLTWHLIGHLQSNKALKALETFEWIHSVDNLKLAQRLDRLAAEHPTLAPRNLCLQVRLRPDPNKSGWEQQELIAALPDLDRLIHVKICGLMVIPPFDLPEAETFAIFQEAQALAQRIQAQGWQNLTMLQLSMGMSDDYALAIKAGATMIRPGRCLFGDRVSHP